MSDSVPLAQRSSAPSLWPERDWDMLLGLMNERNVVPVIGPELLCAALGDNPAAQLYDVWGQALAQRKEIEATPSPDEVPLLYRIADQLSVSENRQPGDLEYEIDSVIRKQQPPWPLPESLRMLAEIRDFPLYVTTTIDHLMRSALSSSADIRGEPLQIVFNPGGNAVTNDLPEPSILAERPTVFHLFGATSTNPGEFAATEDDLVEFSWALIDNQYAPKRLYDFLRRKRLLLLGCNFPDWLERFFIHALAGKRDAQIAVTYVSASRQSGLHDFLRRRFTERSVLPQSPVTFVAELYRRWQTRHQEDKQSPIDRGSAAPKPSRIKPGAVFISYAREDRAKARDIQAQLEAKGIDTWIDDQLEPGAKFEDIIHDNIERASFFVPLISRAFDLGDTDRLGRFVLKELKFAVEVSQSRPTYEGFLKPVILDDTPADAEFIDRPFRDVSCTYLEDNKIPAKFVDALIAGIRRHRHPSGGTMP